MSSNVVTRGGVSFKRRNPWGVVGLSLITLGIYSLVWWYKINNELRNYGIRRDPAIATLAVSLGGFLIVPPYVSTYKTAQAIEHAQERAGVTSRINAGLAVLIILVTLGLATMFVWAYMQSHLNKVWDRIGAQEEAQVEAVAA